MTQKKMGNVQKRRTQKLNQLKSTKQKQKTKQHARLYDI